MRFHLGFHGAAGMVTGSRHLLEIDDSRVLFDAGMFQGPRELQQLNWEHPGFRPGYVDRVVLTHAHIDHSGYLPRLVRDGYKGEILCTPATRQLLGLLLLDAAKLQEEDAAYANRKGYSRHAPALPLFTTADAEATLQRLRPVDYGSWFEIVDGAQARYANAGHILGSGTVEVRVQREKRLRTIVFSGDVGGYDMPLHPDPGPPPACDFLVIESTYGDRVHDRTPLPRQLAGAIGDVLARGGTVLVPAFAVGRAQQVILLLGDMMADGELPRVPIHLDSPMAVDATRIYASHLKDHNLDEGLGEGSTSRLCPPTLKFHRTTEESRALNTLAGPRVIISASGMLTGGRVLHHLARLLPDERNLVLMVGYQAAGTTGRALLEGEKSVRIHGRMTEARAKVTAIHGLSGHGDSDELMRWVRSGPAPRPRAVFVTHGEPSAASAMAGRIEKEIGARAFEPRIGSVYDLESILSA